MPEKCFSLSDKKQKAIVVHVGYYFSAETFLILNNLGIKRIPRLFNFYKQKIEIFVIGDVGIKGNTFHIIKA
jgi:hypothetical protein